MQHMGIGTKMKEVSLAIILSSDKKNFHRFHLLSRFLHEHKKTFLSVTTSFFNRLLFILANGNETIILS